MIGLSGRSALLGFALLTTTGASAAKAVDLHLFADAGKTCTYLSTAGVDEVARIEIWLTILQRDAAGGEARDRLLSTRGDLQRLDGEARTVERAVATIEAQIVEGHALLRRLRDQARSGDARAEIRATSEELIELSFDLRDAKARLAALRTAMAGHHDSAAMIDAAQSTARRFGRVIRECAIERRVSLTRSN
jgi:chromosome segregation ATPase